MTKLIAVSLFLLASLLIADAKPNYTFNSQKAACTLIDGKLILSKMWPIGSWEECAYSILGVASQLDQQNQVLQKQLSQQELKRKK